MRRDKGDGPSSGSRKPFLAAPCLATALLFGVSAYADVLVLRDGSRVTTAGRWEVRETTVVFRDAGHRLLSLQLAQVDLEASRRETARAKSEAKPPPRQSSGDRAPQSRPAAVFTLTDADVEHVPPQDLRNEEAGATEGGAAEPEASGPLVVTEWAKQVDPAIPGVTLRGSVRNTGPDTVGGIRVTVELYDAEGVEVGSTTATVEPPALTPGASGRFQARAPDVLDFADARFQVEALALVTQEQQPAVVPHQVYESRRRAEQPDRH